MPNVRETVVARKRQILEKRLETLFQDYEAVHQQMGQTISNVDENRLARQAEGINRRIDATEAELNALEREYRRELQGASQQDRNRSHLDLQEKLPMIDFKALELALETILKGSRDGYAAILFLLQKSTMMGGKWGGARLREILRKNASDFKHWPVEFQPGSRSDETEILHGLAAYLNIEVSSSLQDYSQAVIQRICGSIQGGSVVFIEFRKWDYLSPQPRVVGWFLRFWQDMVQALARVAQTFPRVKVVVVIFVDGRLPAECLAIEQCCTVETFEKGKVLEILLDKWTREEIQEWLEAYSGLTRVQIDLMADKIYRATEGGFPKAVADELLNECCPRAAG
jgi:hypothetical protein